MGIQWYIHFLMRVQCSFICTFLKHVKATNNKHYHPLSWMKIEGNCLDYYIMCQPCVMPGSMSHPHTTLDWSTHSHNTGLIKKQYIIEICHMSWWRGGACRMGVGLNQKQHIIKGMICGMGLHLVIYNLVNLCFITIIHSIKQLK